MKSAPGQKRTVQASFSRDMNQLSEVAKAETYGTTVQNDGFFEHGFSYGACSRL